MMKDDNNNYSDDSPKNFNESNDEELRSSINNNHPLNNSSDNMYNQENKYCLTNDQEDKDNDLSQSMSKNKIDSNLKMIFMSIAKFNSKEDDYFIMQQNLNKLLRENDTIGKYGIPLYEVDVLYKQVCLKGSKINYDQFVNFIIRLVKKILPDEFEQDSKGTLNAFLGHFFDKFQHVLNNKESVTHSELPGAVQSHKSIEKLIQYIPDNQQKYIIFKISVPLLEIYLAYFDPNEAIVQQQFISRKFYIQNVIAFARDFEIIPFIMNETLIGIYFSLTTEMNNQITTQRLENEHTSSQILENEPSSSQRFHNDQYQENGMKCKAIPDSLNKGIFFTFEHFCLMIIHFAIYSHDKTAVVGDKEIEVGKLLLFLEKLDNSKGMQNMHSKIKKSNLTKISLIPIKQVIDELDIYKKNDDSTNLWKRKNPLSYSMSPEMNDIKEETENSEMIDKNMLDLSRTFLYYSRIANKLNFNQMSLSSYLKFLKDSKLLNEFKECKTFRESIKDNPRESFTLNLKPTPSKEKSMSNQRLKAVRQECLNKNTFQHTPMKFHKYNYAKEKTQSSTMRDTPYIIKTNDSKEKINNTSSFSQEKKKKNNFTKHPNYSNAINENTLNESDASIIYSLITGPKSIEASQKIKANINNSDKGDELNNLGGKVISMANCIDYNESKENSKVYQMDFKQFISSFNHIAHKIFPNESPDVALNRLLTQYIIPNLIQEDSKGTVEHSEQIQAAIEKLKLSDIQIFLERLSDMIQDYYLLYCNEDKEISFYQLFQFYKDFNIFPHMITLILLKDIYFLFSEMNLREKDQSTCLITYKGKMSYKNFLDSLAVIAFIFSFDKELTEIERLMFIVERLIQSKGIEKCRKKSGRFV